MKEDMSAHKPVIIINDRLDLRKQYPYEQFLDEVPTLAKIASDCMDQERMTDYQFCGIKLSMPMNGEIGDEQFWRTR